MTADRSTSASAVNATCDCSSQQGRGDKASGPIAPLTTGNATRGQRDRLSVSAGSSHRLLRSPGSPGIKRDKRRRAIKARNPLRCDHVKRSLGGAMPLPSSGPDLSAAGLQDQYKPAVHQPSHKAGPNGPAINLRSKAARLRSSSFHGGAPASVRGWALALRKRSSGVQRRPGQRRRARSGGGAAGWISDELREA